MTNCLGRFTVRVFRECLSVCMSASLPFGFEGGIRDLIVLYQKNSAYRD